MKTCIIEGVNTQVAFQLPDEHLDAIDALVPGRFSSRAEVLRTAVKVWLKSIEQERIDALLAAGYEVLPRDEEERQWAEISIEGLIAADLDW